jgi:hypothetical protein
MRKRTSSYGSLRRCTKQYNGQSLTSNARDIPEDRPLWLDARNETPQKSDFKPTVRLLSRKPPPKIASPSDPSTGIATMRLADEEDSEEEERKKAAQDFADRQARAQREREEKQRKYQEVRDRLFGSPTPSNEDTQSRASSTNGRNSSRGKGRRRSYRDGQGTSSGDQSPARPQSQRKELYDPGYSVKPNSVYIQKRDTKGSPGPVTAVDEQPVRSPRGPDGSGRGGRGFGARGNKTGALS